MGRARGQSTASLGGFDSAVGARRGHPPEIAARLDRDQAHADQAFADAGHPFGPHHQRVQKLLEALSGCSIRTFERFARTTADGRPLHALSRAEEVLSAHPLRFGQAQAAQDAAGEAVLTVMRRADQTVRRGHTEAAWMARDAALAVSARDLIGEMDYFELVSACPKPVRSALT